MDEALYVSADASMGIGTAPLSAELQSPLRPGGMGENDLPWWHSIDEMIGNLPVDEAQKQRLKVYANAIAYPERAPDLTTDVAGIDGDVLRIVTTGARKIARQQARDAGMNKSTPAIQLFRETVISKAGGGEGSRGGHILGHTKSGKPIYSSAAKFRGNEGFYGDVNKKTSGELESHVASKTTHYSKQDHEDAANAHQKAADAIKPPSLQHDAGGQGLRQHRHQVIADAHRSIAKKMGSNSAPSGMIAIKQKATREKLANSTRALDILRDTLAKAGGEGSRGGRIIGHTKSGKAIYNNGGGHEKYTPKDHADAKEHHEDVARDAGRRVRDHKEDMKAKNGNTSQARRNLEVAQDSQDKHQRLAAQHAKMAGK